MLTRWTYVSLKYLKYLFNRVPVLVNLAQGKVVSISVFLQVGFWKICYVNIEKQGRHNRSVWDGMVDAQVFSAAEYCAPVWSRSPHVKKIDVAINSSLWTISGCLKPTQCFSSCWSKTESSHPRLGTESSETRLAHPTRDHKE